MPVSNSSWSTSTRSPQTVESGGGRRRVRRADRHRRPSMVRAAAKNHPSVAVVADPRGYDGVLAAVRSRRIYARRAQETGVAGFFSTPPSTTSPSPRGCSPRWPRGARPGFRISLPRTGAARRRCATARIRTSRPRSTRPRRLAGSGAGRAVARKRDVLQQLHRRGRRMAGRFRLSSRPCVAIIKHANPCGIAISDICRRRAPQGPRCDPEAPTGA